MIGSLARRGSHTGSLRALVALTVLVALATVLSLVASAGRSQAQTPTVTITAPATATAGTPFTATITVTNVTNLKGVVIDLTATGLQITAASDELPFSSIASGVTNGAGTAATLDSVIFNNQASTDQSKSGTVLVGTLTVVGQFNGTGTLALATARLRIGLTNSPSFVNVTPTIGPAASVIISGGTPPPPPPSNTAPTISFIADQTTAPGTPTAQILFTVGDAQDAPAALIVTASSANQPLVPNGNILLGGAGASRSVILLPAALSTGTARITITVRDTGGLTTPRSFTLTVGTSSSGAPSIIAPPDLSIPLYTSSCPLPFIVSDDITPASSLIVTAATGNPTLVPLANVLLSGSGSGTLRSLIVSPTAGRTGSATITLTVRDGDGLTASDSFVLTVTNPLPPVGGSTLNLVLLEGFNLITYTGPEGATPRQFAEVIGIDRVLGIFRYNGVTQDFNSFFPVAPTFVNSLLDLHEREGLFVLISPGPQIVVKVPQLTQLDPNRVVSLFNGWSLIGYTGSVTTIETLFSRVRNSVVGVFTFDPFTQLYNGNFPDPVIPDFVDMFTLVGPLDVLYILSQRPLPGALAFSEVGIAVAAANN